MEIPPTEIEKRTCEHVASLCFAFHCMSVGAPLPASSGGIPSALLTPPPARDPHRDIEFKDMSPGAQEIFGTGRLRSQLCVVCYHGCNRQVDADGNPQVLCKSCCRTLSYNFRCKGRGSPCGTPLWVHQNGQRSVWCKKCSQHGSSAHGSSAHCNAEKLVDRALNLNRDSTKYRNRKKRGGRKHGSQHTRFQHKLPSCPPQEQAKPHAPGAPRFAQKA